MSPLRIVMLMIAAAFVSACSSPQTTTRNLNAADVAPGATSAAAIMMPNAKIRNITVSVPQTLTVSEANSYFPKGDIVWRGDLYGDRYEQVKNIVMQSAQDLAASLDGTRPVNMHIEVTRFHGLSEKARYSTGGVHNMNFIVTLTDPATGTILRGPRHIVSNLDAFGGKEAIQADRVGHTQKARVTAFLTQVLHTELTQPGGYVDQKKGFFVALNKMK